MIILQDKAVNDVNCQLQNKNHNPIAALNTSTVPFDGFRKQSGQKQNVLTGIPPPF